MDLKERKKRLSSSRSLSFSISLSLSLTHTHTPRTHSRTLASHRMASVLSFITPSLFSRSHPKLNPTFSLILSFSLSLTHAHTHSSLFPSFTFILSHTQIHKHPRRHTKHMPSRTNTHTLSLLAKFFFFHSFASVKDLILINPFRSKDDIRQNSCSSSSGDPTFLFLSHFRRRIKHFSF